MQSMLPVSKLSGRELQPSGNEPIMDRHLRVSEAGTSGHVYLLPSGSQQFFHATNVVPLGYALNRLFFVMLVVLTGSLFFSSLGRY